MTKAPRRTEIRVQEQVTSRTFPLRTLPKTALLRARLGVKKCLGRNNFREMFNHEIRENSADGRGDRRDARRQRLCQAAGLLLRGFAGGLRSRSVDRRHDV